MGSIIGCMEFKDRSLFIRCPDLCMRCTAGRPQKQPVDVEAGARATGDIPVCRKSCTTNICWDEPEFRLLRMFFVALVDSTALVVRKQDAAKLRSTFRSIRATYEVPDSYHTICSEEGSEKPLLNTTQLLLLMDFARPTVLAGEVRTQIDCLCVGLCRWTNRRGHDQCKTQSNQSN